MATQLGSSDKKVVLLTDKAMIALDLISKEYGVQKHDVLGDSRKEPLPEVRHVIYYMLWDKMDASRIGFMFKKSRGGVRHGHMQIMNLKSSYPKFNSWLEEMERKIQKQWVEQLA